MNRIELLIKEKGITWLLLLKRWTHKAKLICNIEKSILSKLEKVAEALDVPMWQLFASPEEVKGEEENTITCPHCGKKIKLEKGE